MRTIERRSAPRLNLHIPLRFRPIPAGGSPVQAAESLNISRRGICFATDVPLKVGNTLELFLKMPQEISGRAPADVRCTGRIVHLQPNPTLNGRVDVGVQLEAYETVQAERWAS